LGPTSTRWQKDTFVRIQPEGKNKGVVVAEQERVVQVVVGPSGTILDCVAGRRKYHLLEALMAEVEAFEESGEFPMDVEFVEVETDVGWYGRQCRRSLRNELRDGELGESLLAAEELEELRGRAWVQGRIPGTQFCSRQLPRLQLVEANLGTNKALDQCCLDLYTTNPLESLEYKHSLLNPSIFPMFPCPALATFLTCLAEIHTEEASRLAKVWGEYGGHCFNLQTNTRCIKYNTWFTECLEGNATEVAVRGHVMDIA